jgi:hypothetical protein
MLRLVVTSDPFVSLTVCPLSEHHPLPSLLSLCVCSRTDKRARKALRRAKRAAKNAATASSHSEAPAVAASAIDEATAVR